MTASPSMWPVWTMHSGSGVSRLPREIKAAVLDHPVVEDAGMVGIDHFWHGKEPVALMISDDVDETGLRAFLDGRLADYKEPVDAHPVE